MDSWTKTASSHLTDWQPWNWYATSAVIVLSAALLAFVVLAIRVILDEDLSVRWYFLVPGVVLILAALGCLLGLPGTLMRHLPHHESVWWVAIPCVTVAGAFAIAGHNLRIRLLYVPAATLALGVIFGALDDALKRAASSFPTSVLGLIVTAATLVALTGYAARK